MYNANSNMMVAALENGTVIDHIPNDKLFAVVRLLQLEQATTSVTIGYQLTSRKMGSKSIIKVADRFFTDEEISRLSVVAPSAVLNIIRNYKVSEKKAVTLPDDIIDLVTCPNPKCITNNEPMKTHFHVVDRTRGIIKCRYCEKSQPLNSVTLK